MHKPLWVLFALLLAPFVRATEVSSITACKPEGEIWICASWKDNRMAVYRSQHYLSGIEFAGEVESGSIKVPMRDAASGIKARSVNAASGDYTLQLLACNSAPCEKRLQQLMQIPSSYEVEIKNDNTLWKVLLVGQYRSIKSAQQAAAELIGQYKLRDKPWVRTLDSISRRRVSP
tara:strand:+ start:4579 stop:5103 length:525 start_codon:yes stop_codon:yes gene_type:complete